MTSTTIKSKKLNKKALIIIGIFATLFALPYLLIGFLPKAVFSYFLGEFIVHGFVFFGLGFVVYRLIRGKYLSDEKKFANKVWWAKFLAVLIMLFIAITPLIRIANEIPKS